MKLSIYGAQSVHNPKIPYDVIWNNWEPTQQTYNKYTQNGQCTANLNAHENGWYQQTTFRGAAPSILLTPDYVSAVQSEIVGEVDRRHPLLQPPGVEHRPVSQVDELHHLLGKWQTITAVQPIDKSFENTRRASAKQKYTHF
jgi:hypothetical protein